MTVYRASPCREAPILQLLQARARINPGLQAHDAKDIRCCLARHPQGVRPELWSVTVASDCPPWLATPGLGFSEIRDTSKNAARSQDVGVESSSVKLLICQTVDNWLALQHPLSSARLARIPLPTSRYTNSPANGNGNLGIGLKVLREEQPGWRSEVDLRKPSAPRESPHYACLHAPQKT